MLHSDRKIMHTALVVLTLASFAAVAAADVEVRVWLTTQDPASIINFRPGYGPFTPFTTGSNESGPYDIHRNYVSTTNPGDVVLNPGNQKFSLSSLIVEEPTCLTPGTPVYIWAAFCGAGDEPPQTPGLGWEDAGTKIVGMHLVLVTAGGLSVTPTWYQYASAAGYRWETTGDFFGPEVVLVALGAWGFSNSPTALDRMQANQDDSTGTFGAAAILLGAIQPDPATAGSLQVGLGHMGIASNRYEDDRVSFFPGTETTAIPAGVVPQGSPPRVGATVQATWTDHQQPCSAVRGCVRAAGRGIAGVQLTGGLAVGLTDQTGCYQLLVPYNWTGTITPTKLGYTFDPAGREYSAVTTDQDNQDYAAIPEVDCNNNGVYDPEDIATGASPDCNDNGIPDECDLATGSSHDCNTNGVPDECDIAGGTSQDGNSDGVPDECQVGDMNCDGVVNFDDLNPFVLALVGHAQYVARYPDCQFENADINHDGYSDFDDINPFVACLVAGGCP